MMSGHHKWSEIKHKKEGRMALSRAEAEANGLAFIEEGVRYRSDPDIEHFTADLTIDGHTEHFEGKSEEDVLLAAERVLNARGRFQTEGAWGSR